MKISLCLLNLNEIEALNFILPLIIKNYSKLNIDEIIVIEGGSTDGSIDLFNKYNLKIFYQKSKGIGNAIIEAINHINSDYIIFFNPDGNENVYDIAKFKKYFANGFDLVIASRMMQGAFNEEDIKLIKFRKWANNAFTFFVNLFYGKNNKYITDTINGFRGGKTTLLRNLNLNTTGHAIEYQMTIRSLVRDYNITEFPTYEYPRIGGKTSAPSIKTGIIFLLFLFKEIFIDRFK